MWRETKLETFFLALVFLYRLFFSSKENQEEQQNAKEEEKNEYDMNEADSNNKNWSVWYFRLR